MYLIYIYVCIYLYIYIHSHAEELKKTIIKDNKQSKTEDSMKNLLRGDKKKSRERRVNKIDTMFMDEWRKIKIEKIKNGKDYKEKIIQEKKIIINKIKEEKKRENIKMWEDRERERKLEKAKRISLDWHLMEKVAKIAYWREFNENEESKVWESYYRKLKKKKLQRRR